MNNVNTAKQMKRLTKFQKFEVTELANDFMAHLETIHIEVLEDGDYPTSFIIKAGKVIFNNYEQMQVLSVNGEMMIMWDGEYDTIAADLYTNTFSPLYDLDRKQFETFEEGKRVTF